MQFPREWVEFESSPPPRSGKRPYVSLNDRGILVFNRLAYSLLGEPLAVSLHTDKRNCAIGIRPCGLLMPNAFPISQRGNYNYVIRAKAYMVARHITLSGTIRFLNPVIEGDMLVVDMVNVARTTQTPRKGWRKKKKGVDYESRSVAIEVSENKKGS